LLAAISKFLRRAEGSVQPGRDLALALLESWAREQDRIMEQGLLGDLILRYSQAERMLADVNQQLKTKTIQLEEANRILERVSNQDGLTGIANRRYLDAFLEREYRRCARAREPLAVILGDIDHFKGYNDTYGHLAGDECLKRVAETLAACLKRPGDLAARYGGEEFVLALPETNLQGAYALAEAARAAVEALGLPHGASSAAAVVTVSLGVASRPALSHGEPSEIVALADAALYAAKAGGRNRVQAALQPAGT
jgi:diguanylate cyclase (GGDEF)-like protein